MASTGKIIEMIGAIKTIYPYYAKGIGDNQVAVLVRTWETLLKEYRDEVVETAFYKCLQTCKTPPTPADVIEQIKDMVKSLEPSDEEMWTVYENALRAAYREIQQFPYTYVDETGVSQGTQARRRFDKIWEGLPEKIKSYLASPGELMRIAREYCLDNNAGTFEKQRFMKSMPVMTKRIESNQLIAGKEQWLLGEG